MYIMMAMSTPGKEGPCQYLTADVFQRKENLPGFGKVVVEYPGCSYPGAGGSAKGSCVFAQRPNSPTESGCGFAKSMELNTTSKVS